MELFAVKPPDLVTIAEIVQHVGMTPAAFYYHFSSRDELFQEVVDRFGEQWAEHAEECWAEADAHDDALAVVGRLLDWAVEHRQHATVFFVTSKGVSVAIEEARLAVTARTAAAAGAAIARGGSAGGRCRRSARRAVGHHRPRVLAPRRAVPGPDLPHPWPAPVPRRGARPVQPRGHRATVRLTAAL